MKIGRWSTTAANNNATPPDGWPEGQAPSTVNDCARENMAAIKTAMQDMDFFDHDFTPTFVNANSFTVPGDQTARIVANRRLKLFDGSTIYRTVATASYTVVTTISLDAGTAITSSLSSFAISIINPNNSAIPPNNAFDRLSASAIEVTTLSVSGATVLKSTLSVEGATVLSTTLSVSGAAVLKSTLSVGGAVNLEGATALGTTLSVSGAAVLKGALSVGGAAILEGAVTLGTTLSVSGAAVLKSTLSLGGAATFAGTLSVSGTVVAANICKAWARFSSGGLTSNFNVGSISKSASGIYRLTFTNALPDALYAWNINTELNAGGQLTYAYAVSATAATYKFVVKNVSEVLTDLETGTAFFYR